MKARHWMIVLRAATLVALAASMALLLDYTGTSPTFCTAADTGCGAVRATVWARPLGIPMPIYGVAGFAVVFALSMASNESARRALPVVAGLGGVAALGLIAVQAFAIKTFCSLCLIADAGAIIAGIAGVLLRRAGTETAPKKKGASRAPAAESLRPWAWWALAMLAVAAPAVWPAVRPAPPVPEPIRALYVPGKINVVEFADYECPFCRALHPQIKQLVSEYGADVHFVRMNMPLKSHPDALPAAKAAVCAEKQGKGDPMADALFAAEDLSLSAIRRTAVGLGVDAQKFDQCLKDPETLARIHREEQTLRSAGFEGLPTTYIGATKIVGAREEAVFREAFEKAKRGEGDQGIPPWLYVTLVGVLIGGTVQLGRSKG